MMRAPALWRGTADGLSSLGVLVLAVSLLLNLGTYWLGLVMMALGLVWRGLYRRQSLDMPLALGVFIGLMLAWLVQGVLVAKDPPGAMAAPLLGAMLVAVGVFHLPPRPCTFLRWEPLLAGLLVFCVTLHFVYDVFWMRWPKVGKSALFGNIHYMGQYAVLTLPFFVMEGVKSAGRVRWLMIILLLADLWLLLESRSRPGYLGAVASLLVILPFLGRGLRWQGLGLLLGVCGILYAANVAHFQERINDLLLHFREDERGEIWIETFALQSRSTFMEWVFGRGIGQFAHDYQVVSLLKRIKPYWAPHCFVLEILYSHGVIGLVSVSGAFFLFFQQLVRGVGMAKGPDRSLGFLLLAMATGLLVNAFFIIPFWSRNFLYPMSLVVGASFLYLQWLSFPEKHFRAS